MAEKLAPGVSWTKDPGGRKAVQIENGADKSVVSLTGAQVLSWCRNGRDVLWTASKAEYAKSAPVRGGVPLVFPWFGDHPTDTKLPAHGFARTIEWQLVHSNEGPEVVFEATDDDKTRAMWPHPFRLRLSVQLSASLRLLLSIENTGGAPFVCEHALHTYFAVGDVATASVHGLEGIACTELAAAPQAHHDEKKPLSFRAETDRVFQDVPDRLELRAPALERTVVLKTSGARSAIVWNPWSAKGAKLSQLAGDDWQRFLCIESANVREHRVQLAPGERHALSLRLEC